MTPSGALMAPPWCRALGALRSAQAGVTSPGMRWRSTSGVSSSTTGQRSRARAAGDKAAHAPLVTCMAWCASGQLGHGETVVAVPPAVRGEHPRFPASALLPLGAGRDDERPHVGCGVDQGDVDGERRQSAVAVGLGRGGEVAVPRLVGRPGERHVEAHLDDGELGPEDGAGDAEHPGVGGELGEAAQLLGVDLGVPALRPATACSTSAWLTSPTSLGWGAWVESGAA